MFLLVITVPNLLYKIHPILCNSSPDRNNPIAMQSDARIMVVGGSDALPRMVISTSLW